jgi:NIPSNAP
MIKPKWTTAAIAIGMFAAGFAARGTVTSDVAYAQTSNRVFELRTYTANPGKFDAMKNRFRESIIPLFKKHNLTVVGFWTPADAPNSENTLIYVLAHPDREAAKKNWAAFREDPVRAKVWAETEKDGAINQKVESVYMNPLDFSPIK